MAGILCSQEVLLELILSLNNGYAENPSHAAPRDMCYSISVVYNCSREWYFSIYGSSPSSLRILFSISPNWECR